MQDNFTKIYYETSAAKALVSFIKNDYCLVILNTQISDMDCVKMLRIMRQAKPTPILVFTNSWSREMILSLYNLGADACIDKSSGVEICIAQAYALLRLYNISVDINYKQHDLIICGNELVISPLYRQVVTNGNFLELTRKEFDLLYYLASHSEQVFSWRQLYRQVWNTEPTDGDKDTIKVHIRNLRKKFLCAGEKCIHNIWGVGYKFHLESKSRQVDKIQP